MQDELDKEQTERARWLFAQECRFVAGAATHAAIPILLLPEIAFVGRSNVGKSSLVNALTGRKTLAKVSQTPGRTRQLNFFALAEKLMLVDLPGYGYAKASKDMVAGWNQLIRDYLKGRANLHRVCMLIDSRHGVKPVDREIMQLLDETAVCYQLILTKADKSSQADIASHIHFITSELAKKHVAMHPEVIITSSKEGKGMDTLRKELAAFAIT